MIGTSNKSRFLVTNSFQVISILIILSLATTGMGSYVFGIFVFTDVSTLFIYFILCFQTVTRTLRFPSFLIIIYCFILIQTFVLNFNETTLALSAKYFLGVLIYSITIFSFITVYKTRVVEIIRIYYKFVFFIASIAVLQMVLFVCFDKSFIPQNFLSGSLSALQSNRFRPEILGFLPRVIGLSTEPSHFAILCLPGVYIAILVLTGKGGEFGFNSKIMALIIIIGLLFSFSLMGYLGLTLCLVFIFANHLKRNLLKKVLISIPFIGLILFSFHSPIGNRLTTLTNMLKNIRGYEYSVNDLSGWALVSNILVANEGLQKSHYLGTGLNTHKNTYDETIHILFQPKQIVWELNKDNAGSLFIRVVSEFGIPGIAGLVFFLLHFRLDRSTKPSPVKTINTMSLVILLSYCARNGTYLNVFLMLFLAIYYWTYSIERTKFEQIGS